MLPDWMTPEVIIAISSVFIALCALVTTLWQGFLTRKHNRLSVKPFLSVHCEISKGDRIGIALKNNGIGPLVLTSGSINRRGKCEGLYSSDFIKLFPELRTADFRFEIITGRHSLLPNQSIWIISSDMHKTDTGLIKLLDEALKEVFIDVEFESIYGEKDSATSILNNRL